MSETSVSAVIRGLAAPHANFSRQINHLKRHPNLLDSLLAAMSSKTARLRLGSSKALRILSEHAPEMIYPHCELFVNLLRNQNSVLRWNAMLVLGNLARVDNDQQIDRIIDAYLVPIPGPHMIDASNTMLGAIAIATAKPYLADKIADRILTVEKGTYDRPECRQVAIGHAIKSFRRLLPLVSDQRAIQLFVLRQLDNTRPATRKKAEEFLRKWLQRSAEN